MVKDTYLSAGEFPVKLAQQADQWVKNGRIAPAHIQLIPTNRCNLSCEWCSCRDQDSNEEMAFADAQQVIRRFMALGAVAVTITGGGEPCLYANLSDLIDDVVQLGLKAGLVTNGYLLDRPRVDALQKLTWARISVSDDRNILKLFGAATPAVEATPSVDWGLSYVVTTKPSFGNITGSVEFANRHKNVKYVRFISNLEDGYEGFDVESLKAVFSEAGIDDSKVIYQGAKAHGMGDRKCLVSLLKPVIAADGNWYPCCGSSYSRPDAPYGYTGFMSMGNHYERTVATQAHWDGTECDRCYFQDYNRFLGILTQPIGHKEFI